MEPLVVAGIAGGALLGGWLVHRRMATRDRVRREQLRHGWRAEAHFCQAATSEGELDFDYRLRPGRIERPNAIALLARTGYPDGIVQRAMQLVEAHASGHSGA